LNLPSSTLELGADAEVSNTLKIIEIPAVKPPRIAPRIPGVADSINTYASLLSLEKTRLTANIVANDPVNNSV